jgi:ABC-type antimicrobial peptide transport system permease subunit
VNQKAPPIVYWPMLMHRPTEGVVPVRYVSYVIRSSRAGTEPFLKEIKQAVWSVNPNLPLDAVKTMADIYASSMAATSFAMLMLMIAGGMALMLGIVGTYGVISYAASQRTREIGIRIALGAQQSHVKRMFVRQALSLAGIGAAFGIATAAALCRLMTSMLFSVQPVDSVTYGVVTTALLAAVAVASYIPARKATIVDAADALRSE